MWSKCPTCEGNARAAEEATKAEEARKAAEFYAATFPDSHVGRAMAAPDDFPGGQEAEFILRRIAGFYRAGKTSRVAEAKALDIITEWDKSLPDLRLQALLNTF